MHTTIRLSFLPRNIRKGHDNHRPATFVIWPGCATDLRATYRRARRHGATQMQARDLIAVGWYAGRSSRLQEGTSA